MIYRPTDDDCARYGSPLDRALHRRNIYDRGDGSRRMRGGGGGAPAPWTPANLFGVGEADGAFWDPRSPGTLVSGEVDAWPDLSGYAHTATAPSAGARPAYNATDADFNSEPSLNFVATTPDYLVLAGTGELQLDANEAIEIVVVRKSTALGGANGKIVDKRVGDGYNFGESSTIQTAFIYDTTTGANQAVQTYAATSTARADVLVVRGQYNPAVAGGTYYAYINGTAGVGATTGQGGNPNVATALGIGANASGGNPYDGKVAFLLIRIGLVFSVAERASLLAYLNDRFGQSWTGV